MQNNPFEPVRLTPNRRLRARRPALRYAPLLLGTSFLLHAAPVWAANECGVPPPAGGTVTCPAGEYPGGIDYTAPADLEILLDPGVVTRSESTIVSAGDLRLIGPTGTSLNASLPGGDLALDVDGLATVNIELDALSGSDSRVADVSGVGSVTFIANSLTSTSDGGPFGAVLNVAQSAGGANTGALVRVGTISTNGFLNNAATISAASGVARIEAGNISQGGSSSTALSINGPVVMVDVGAINTLGPYSVGLVASGGVLSLDVGSVHTLGSNSDAINASATGDIALTAGSIVTESRDFSLGIRAFSNSGNVTITTGTIAVGTGSPVPVNEYTLGILTNSDTGNVAINSGTITVVSGEGIRATSESGSVTVSADLVAVSGANIFTTTDAIFVRSRTGAVTVTAGAASATDGGAIRATTDSGAIRIGAGNVASGGNFNTVVANSLTGSVTVTAETVTAAGGTGISAQSNGGPVAVTAGRVVVGGIGAPGISATSVEGAVAVNSGSIETSGSSSAGIAATASTELVIRSGSIVTSGQFSPGITAFADTGPVTITSGSITTAGSRGIDISTNSGDINITSGNVALQGSDTGFGIFASSTTGNISVSSNTIATTAALANGIFAINENGSITVASGPIRTLGDSATGVVTFVRGPGATSIKAGSITTQGFDSYGVIATSIGTGAIDVTGDGTIVTTGASSPGISAESVGRVTVSANNVSASGADSDAIAVKGSTSTVTVRGLVQSSSGFAVRGEGGLRQRSDPGGPVTVNILTGGTVLGRVSLTGGIDQISNSGTFDSIGSSQFGAGADLFANQTGGTLRSVNGASVLAGLESFVNQGRIELRDGATGDSLNVTGAFSGLAGSRLGLDVDFTASTADRLIVGAATGSTLIDLTTRGIASSFDSILLVDAGAGTSATAFSLGGVVADTPYLRSSLRFDAAGNDFFLVQAPGTAAFETARFAGMAARLWYESADAVAAQLDTARDGRGGRGIGLWLQAWTGEQESQGIQSFGGGTLDVSFEQDFQGLQGGLDFQTGAVAVGITGGAGRSDSTFLATGNPVDMEVRNIGAYVQGRSGLLFFNALAKYDWAELEIAPGAGLGASFDADSFGVQANAGVRLGFGTVFAEPSVGLSWVQSEVEAFASGPATVGPGEGESLRARAGLRVGAKLPLGGGALFPFVAVNAYEELSGDNSSDFTLGDTLRLFDEPPGTRGQAAAGVSFAAGSFEAFVRGDMDFSGGNDAKSVRAGARLRF